MCSACDKHYPVIDGVPVLINEDNSVFRIADYAGHAGYEGASGHGGALDSSKGLRRLYRRFTSGLSNLSIGHAGFPLSAAIEHVRQQCPDAAVLVVGAGDETYEGPGFVYTDVAFGRNVACICDSHDLPFPDSSFDLVILISVLEHVVDPNRCVAEVTRVLRPAGFVYAVTPFLQPVHMRAHDFTRFTYLGHRRLFRAFDDIQSGTAGGPGNTLAHVARYALLSLSDNRRTRSLLRLMGLILTLPLRYADYLLDRKKASYDAAWSVFFFGRRRTEPIPDREILALYRGGP